MITGDILQSSTWGKIDEYLRTQAKGGKFGLILCHPIAGDGNIPRNLFVYRYIFNHIYRVLSPHEGIFLTNFHRGLSWQVSELCKVVSTVEGIEATCDIYSEHLLNPTFMLKRLPNSPERLPLLKADKTIS